MNLAVVSQENNSLLTAFGRVKIGLMPVVKNCAVRRVKTKADALEREG